MRTPGRRVHFVLLGGCKSQTVLIDPLMEAIAQDEELRGDEEQTLERSGFLATTDMIPGPVFFRTTLAQHGGARGGARGSSCGSYGRGGGTSGARGQT